VNYFGEIVQGVALALPGWLVSGELLPWLYPLYYVALFILRQAEDDEACAMKYGAAWGRYCAIVPHRIVPGLF
jgi:delta14-sterol reductase